MVSADYIMEDSHVQYINRMRELEILDAQGRVEGNFDQHSRRMRHNGIEVQAQAGSSRSSSTPSLARARATVNGNDGIQSNDASVSETFNESNSNPVVVRSIFWATSLDSSVDMSNMTVITDPGQGKQPTTSLNTNPDPGQSAAPRPRTTSKQSLSSTTTSSSSTTISEQSSASSTPFVPSAPSPRTNSEQSLASSTAPNPRVIAGLPYASSAFLHPRITVGQPYSSRITTPLEQQIKDTEAAGYRFVEIEIVDAVRQPQPQRSQPLFQVQSQPQPPQEENHVSASLHNCFFVDMNELDEFIDLTDNKTSEGVENSEEYLFDESYTSSDEELEFMHLHNICRGRLLELVKNNEN